MRAWGSAILWSLPDEMTHMSYVKIHLQITYPDAPCMVYTYLQNWMIGKMLIDIPTTWSIMKIYVASVNG